MYYCQRTRSVVQPIVIKGVLFISSVLIALIIQLGPAAVPVSGSSPVVTVTVTVDGQEWEWKTSQATVGGILKEAGVHIDEKDEIQPSRNTKASQHMRIRVTRVEERIVIQTEPIAYKTTHRFNPQATGGRRVIQEGERGEKEIKYLVTYRDGAKSGHKVLSARVLKDPVDEVVLLTNSSQFSARGGSVRSLRMVATAYDPGPRSCGRWADGRTSIGMRAGHGVVAVDPRVIPLRTKLYVEGYGFCVAGDVGGAIKGNRIDLGFNTYAEAKRFGRRTVTVYILD